MEVAMPRKRKPHETVNLRLRLTEELREMLTAEAEKANRSLNSEILWRLGQTFGEEWKRFVAEMEDHERREREWVERMRKDPRLQEALVEIIAKHFPEWPIAKNTEALKAMKGKT
jgi:hypothetical protein